MIEWKMYSLCLAIFFEVDERQLLTDSFAQPYTAGFNFVMLFSVCLFQAEPQPLVSKETKIQLLYKTRKLVILCIF